MSEKLSEEEGQDLAAKIDSEGFDYYFTDYGPDEKLERLVGREIEAYRDARDKLMGALHHVGVDVGY